MILMSPLYRFRAGRQAGFQETEVGTGAPEGYPRGWIRGQMPRRAGGGGTRRTGRVLLRCGGRVSPRFVNGGLPCSPGAQCILGRCAGGRAVVVFDEALGDAQHFG